MPIERNQIVHERIYYREYRIYIIAYLYYDDYTVEYEVPVKNERGSEVRRRQWMTEVSEDLTVEVESELRDVKEWIDEYLERAETVELATEHLLEREQSE